MEHWTGNADLLEEYVMGRLEADAAKGLEEHLLTCDQCRRAVAAERAFVSGVKRYGRDALKERLADRVTSMRASGIPWPHVAGVAAVLLIAVGLGIYAQWQWLKPAEVQTEEELGATAGTVEKKDLPQAGGEGPPPPPLSGPGASDDSRTVLAAPLAAEQAPRVEERESRQKYDLEMQEEAAPAPQTRELAKNKVSQLWVQGVILESDLLTAKPADEARAKSRLEDRPRAQRPGNVEISQRAFGELPARLQQAHAPAESVLTLIEQSATGLRFILYTDHVSVEGREIQLEPITNDSLVVSIDGIRIGYRVPADWMQPVFRTK